jgi:PII-like signaling protein
VHNGDFNTIGRHDPPPISAQEELAVEDRELLTEYVAGRAGALDHVVVSMGMQEVAATARVTGYRALAGCADIAGAMPAAAERLSDHCPVVVEIQDRDLD